MPKAKNSKALPIDEATIQKAADTNSIKALVALADACSRVELKGPFTVSLPGVHSAFIGGTKNQYRRFNVPIGKRFNLSTVSIGKKVGLIFSLLPAEEMRREGEPVTRVEMTWDDIINHFDDLSEQIEEHLNAYRDEEILVEKINDAIREAVSKNGSMHKILTEGFALAQAKSKELANVDQLEEIPGFGSF